MALFNSLGYRVLRRLGLVDAAARLGRGHLKAHGSATRAASKSSRLLIEEHFATYSDQHHPCRSTLTFALEALRQTPAMIVETGSSAWGTNSTLLFDAYCNSFGGQCHSVDIRLDPMLQLKKLASNSTTLYCNDSVSFLRALNLANNNIDLLYLDSWDVDWADPIPSAIHGLNEYLTAIKSLRPGALVLIDDTPKDLATIQNVQPQATTSFIDFQERFGFAPGKGTLVKRLVESTGRGTILAHEYQLLIRI
jgi:hypothetical protein